MVYLTLIRSRLDCTNHRFKSTKDSLKPILGIRISLEGGSPYHNFSFQVTVRLLVVGWGGEVSRTSKLIRGTYTTT